MIGEPVTRVRPGEKTDGYGATVADWDAATRTTIEGCALAPRREGEDRTMGRQGVIVGWTLYTPPGVDIRATDRIEARGETYEIDGEPGDWRRPSTDQAIGVELALRRVEG